eukprot:4212386-Pleurochrysis_carterae.AAC.1
MKSCPRFRATQDGGVEYADRAHFSWEPAAAFVRKLDNTIAYQQGAGTQAATGAASLLSFVKNRLVEFRGRYPVSGAVPGTPARAAHGGES